MNVRVFAIPTTVMPATRSVSTFHHWLLSGDPQSTGGSAIVLQGAGSGIGGSLAENLAAHLNQYDDSSEPAWLAVTPALLQAIASDTGNRRLLGIGEGCANCPPSSPCGLKKTLVALATRGRVILDSPLAAGATGGFGNVFNVGVGFEPEGLAECHIIINPRRFPEHCIASVIGDVFLEWLNCPCREKPLLHGV
jgi:hypothetical protein